MPWRSKKSNLKDGIPVPLYPRLSRGGAAKEGKKGTMGLVEAKCYANDLWLEYNVYELCKRPDTDQCYMSMRPRPYVADS